MSTTINNFTGPFDPANWQILSLPSPVAPTVQPPALVVWQNGNTSFTLTNAVTPSVANPGPTQIIARIMGEKGSGPYTISFQANFNPAPSVTFFYAVNDLNNLTPLNNGTNTVSVNPGDLFVIGLLSNDLSPAYSLSISSFACSNFVYSENTSLFATPYNSYNLIGSNNGSSWTTSTGSIPVLLTALEPNLMKPIEYGFYGGHLMLNSRFISSPSISILRAEYTEGEPQPLAIPLSFPNQQTGSYLGGAFNFCQPIAPNGYVSLGNVNVGNNPAGQLPNFGESISYLLNYRCVHASYTNIISPNALMPIASVTGIGSDSSYLNIWQLPTSGYFLYTIGAENAYPCGQIRDLDPNRTNTNLLS